MNVELTFLADSLRNEMVVEVCSLDGEIDVFGMYFERMFASDIEDIGMPVDTDLLSDVGQVQGVMQRSGFFNGDVGGLKIMYKLINDGSAIEGEFLVKEFGAGGKVHFRNVGCINKRSKEESHN